MLLFPNSIKAIVGFVSLWVARNRNNSDPGQMTILSNFLYPRYKTYRIKTCIA